MLGGVGIDVGVAVVVGSAAGLRSDFDLGAISIPIPTRFAGPDQIRSNRIGSCRCRCNRLEWERGRPGPASAAASSFRRWTAELRYHIPFTPLAFFSRTPFFPPNNPNSNPKLPQAEIAGPAGTPYESRYFQLKLVLSADFPSSPPRGYFLTKIYHPNVDSHTGAICVNTLKRDWTPATTMGHVLGVIRCLLIVPFPESSLNDEAGRLFMDSYAEYARRARLLADVHGRPEPFDAEFGPENDAEDLLGGDKSDGEGEGLALKKEGRGGAAGEEEEVLLLTGGGGRRLALPQPQPQEGGIQSSHGGGGEPVELGKPGGRRGSRGRGRGRWGGSRKVPVPLLQGAELLLLGPARAGEGRGQPGKEDRRDGQKEAEEEEPAEVVVCVCPAVQCRIGTGWDWMEWGASGWNGERGRIQSNFVLTNML